MTNEELQAIVDGARARQDEITQGPWEIQTDEITASINGDSVRVLYVDNDYDEVYGGGQYIGFGDMNDAELITAAPDLNAAVIALADENEQLRLGRDITNAQLTSIYRTSKENFETSVKTLKSIGEVRSMVEELIVERDKLQADLNQAQGRALSLERELDRMYRRHNGG